MKTHDKAEGRNKNLENTSLKTPQISEGNQKSNARSFSHGIHVKSIRIG